MTRDRHHLKGGCGLLLLGVSVGCVTLCLAQEHNDRLSDPIEILKRADAASKAVGSVRYSVRTRGILAGASHAPVVEGTVIMRGWSSTAPQRYRCDAKIRLPSSAESMNLTVGFDGEVYYLLDHGAKRAYVAQQAAVLGATGRRALTMIVAEFVHPTPFSQEIDGTKQRLQGGETIGDEECYEIGLAYKSVSQEAIWWFSRNDFLPRGVQRIFNMPDGQVGGQEWKITRLEVDPKFPENAFKFILPQGYLLAAGFAP